MPPPISAEALNGRRGGPLVVTFSAGGTRGPERRASVAEPAASVTYAAGVAGRLLAVTGSVDLDNNPIAVSAPYSVIGEAGRKGTTRWRFARRAEKTLIDFRAAAPPDRGCMKPAPGQTCRAGSVCAAQLIPPPPSPRRA